jgi:hypothetical protein
MYAGMSISALATSAFNHVSVIQIRSGLLASTRAINSSIFGKILLALKYNICK